MIIPADPSPMRTPMGELSDAEGHLYDSVGRLAERGPFVEVLAEAATGLSAHYDGHTTTFQTPSRIRGAVFRAWTGTGWTEVSVSGLDAPSLRFAEGMIERVLSHRPAHDSPPGVSSTARLEKVTPTARPMRDMAEEEMGTLARDVFSWTTGVPDIHETQVQISWRQDERLYLNSAAARCLQGICRVRGAVLPVAMENGRVESDRFVHGGVGGREVLDALTPENARKAAESARDLLRAKAPPAGKLPVLLSPSLTGYFAHESFGHGAEADQFVRNRSYLQPMLGQVLAPEILTIVDNGAYPGAWSEIYCDDEGHPAQRTVLVDHGRFTGALHDRDTAAALGTLPTGNTRRSDFLSRAYVRMTNTYVEPGESSFDELVQEARNGVLLESGSAGIEDPQGGQIQIKARKGHLIENGKVTDLVSSMALSGRVLEFLTLIRGVSGKQDFALDTGACGKGRTDLLPNSAGGPYLLSSAVVGRA
ncbi:MAG TPA: TldD/PmbA family protein [Thermoplasmata archaeon]